MRKLAEAFRLSGVPLAIIVNVLLVSQTAAFNETLENTQLKAGDVLLVPLNCYVCNAIEKETDVPYSHSVVVATSTNDINETYVYEAWGEVKRTPLTEIFERAQKGQNLFHLRPIEFQSHAFSEQEIASVFKSSFEGLPFDDLFLWDNFSDSGKEKLYCSEFVLKFINTFLKSPEPPSPMSFGVLSDFWKKYYDQFNQEIPEGQPGVSPATLFHSTRFEKLGSLTTPIID
ncbi:MAG: hypothetical protein RJB13_1592 [Pseudomonadota bacterium]